ncbi:Retrotransposon gag protein [Phytophthora infestans]|uniref:Retrotransposon gag protein n=1 Tax=Phytophthora infestans TaxID=4787 RepID=A0A833SD77_PHYIN|nr:Retrotransposon gag protein [Phytophthora infestans]
MPRPAYNSWKAIEDAVADYEKATSSDYRVRSSGSVLEYNETYSDQIPVELDFSFKMFRYVSSVYQGSRTKEDRRNNTGYTGCKARFTARFVNIAASVDVIPNGRIILESDRPGGESLDGDEPVVGAPYAAEPAILIGKFKVEGTSIPHFSEMPDESVDEFIFCAKMFMQGKNLNYDDQRNDARVVAMLASSLRAGAASWYHTRVAIEQRPIANISDFHDALTHEFVPPDLQYRIRAALRKCRQTKGIDDYVAEFRRLIAQVREMSQLDQIDHFCEGLKPETRKESTYLPFERAHFAQRSRQDRQQGAAFGDTKASHGEGQPEPMDISMVNTRSISKDECRTRNLCFYCKASGHRIHNRPKKPVQGNVHAQQM